MYFGTCWIILHLIFNGLAQDPTANLPQGRVVGIKVYTETSLTPIEIFYGIPYANAPVGNLRFSAPERHSGWRRTLFAHRMPPRCPQQEMASGNFNEDCLYLNIFTPRRVDGNLHPVMVLFYSETWLQGGVTLPCQDLASEGIVVITVNYRLHIFSFFMLNSKEARGNLAILDQYLALLWVRENISAFGGDPNAITLVGHSSGADFVLHHIVSPRSVGLFHRAILMSPRDIWTAAGIGLSINASDVDQVSRKIAEKLGCSSETDRHILNCMRSRSITDIISVSLNISELEYLQPVSDDFLPDSEQYLPLPVSRALTSSKLSNIQIDLLMGTTELEAINYNDLNYRQIINEGSENVLEYAYTKAVPKILRMLSLQEQDKFPLLMQAIRWEFWGRDENAKTVKAVEDLARMESSAKWGAGGTLLASRLARRVTRLYVYQFTPPFKLDLQGQNLNFSVSTSISIAILGAVHGADLIALLGDTFMLQIARRPATDSEKRNSALFRKYITNFIRFGYPENNNIWQQYKVGDAYVQDIRADVPRNYKCLSSSRDAVFWLNYLPNLYNIVNKEQTDYIISEKDENRLRGGVFAMSAVSVVLLFLLTASAILLYWRRGHRYSLNEEDMNHH